MMSTVAAALPAFLASLVEFVEALTIVVAVGASRGWRPALLGATAGTAALAVAVLAFGPALARVPLVTLQLVVGILLAFFGMRWLRKAMLRYAGVIALHDEGSIFERQRLRFATDRPAGTYDSTAIAATFNAVVLEGLEVVFIVIALGATEGALVPAALGALGAACLVVAAGIAIRAPLTRVPENGLKFGVGVMLSAYGTFWIGEGLGAAWPGGDLALVGLAAGFLATASVGVVLARNIVAAERGHR